MMNYYELLLEKEAQKEAVIVDGVSHSYGWLCKEAGKRATQWREEMSENLTGKVRVIKKKDIMEQLLDFLACNATGQIPLLVPSDQKHYWDGEYLLSEPPEDACMAVCTSGTTGKPKIYYRSYESWAGFFSTQNRIFDVTEDSRLFAQGSLAFTGNLNLYLAQFYAGGVVIAENGFQPKRWLERIRESKADSIYLIPTKLMLLPEVAKEKMSGIKMILSGSQSLGREDAIQLKEVFPNTKIVLYYGASELNYVTYVTDEEMGESRNLIGKPFPEVEVFLREDKIYVNTPYHVEGVSCPYSLSDCAYQDEEGNFYFAGRKDDILNIRGRKISALMIENELLQLEGIQEAAVVSQKGQKQTQELLVAYVVIQQDYSLREEEICQKLRQKLSKHEVPRRIYRLDRLPYNESGKVDKNKLIMLQ